MGASSSSESLGSDSKAKGSEVDAEGGENKSSGIILLKYHIIVGSEEGFAQSASEF